MRRLFVGMVFVLVSCGSVSPVQTVALHTTPTYGPEVKTALALATHYALLSPTSLGAAEGDHVDDGPGAAVTIAPTDTPVPTEDVPPTEMPSPDDTQPPTATTPDWPPAFTSALGTVNTTANVRSKPSVKGSTILDTVAVGETVIVRNRTPDGAWYSIWDARNRLGWVSAGLLNVPPDVARQASVSTTDAGIDGDIGGEMGTPVGQAATTAADSEAGSVGAPVQLTPTVDPDHPGDAAFKSELRDKFSMLGQHRLDLESIEIAYLRSKGVDSMMVEFNVSLNETQYFMQEETSADRKAWSEALLQEIKQHWPNQTVYGFLKHAYSSFTVFEDGDCYSNGDYLFDDGWHHVTYYAMVSFAPDLGDHMSCYDK